MRHPQTNPTTPQNPDAQKGNTGERIPLIFCDLDDFEEGLLPILRHFMNSLAHPEGQTWQFAYRTAAQRWGETLGLSVAQALFSLVQYTTKARRHGFECLDPLNLEERSFVSRDERAFLQMLHHMRRDQTPKAREAVADVTGCSMDADVIRAGLSFADRFPAGETASRYQSSRPALRVVG